MSTTVSHIILRRGIVAADWKLEVAQGAGNNGRKHAACQVRAATERPIFEPEWRPGANDGRTPVLEVGSGGTEIATFSEKARQDRHLHRLSTEAYTVLEGMLRISIDDGEPVELGAGDEIVVLPGTVHEIVSAAADAPAGRLLVRMHAWQCYGDADKYVQLAGGGAEWVCWKDLDPGERARSIQRHGLVR